MVKRIFTREEQEAYNIKRAHELYTDPKRIEKYLEFAKLAYDNDVIYFRIDRIAQEYVEDFFDFEGVSDEDKLWAYGLGYSGWKIYSYGLNRDNYRNYISDFEFYNKNNYMNEKFVRWFDHKLSTYYIMAPFINEMPRHYYYISNGQIMPLNVDGDKNATANDVVELIIKNKLLVAKACIGGHGVGFYKFQYKDGILYQNTKEISKENLLKLIENLDDYIITEYAEVSQTFKQACGEDTFAVLRTVMVYDPVDGPQLTGAVIRLGTKETGLVSDYPGSINCGVELKTGKLYNPLYRGDLCKFDSIKYHPDTNVKLDEIVVDDWDSLVEICKKVSKHLAMTPYLVMDIIPSDNGFKILEINSHGQVRIMEPFYPFLLNKYNRKVFNIKD